MLIRVTTVQVCDATKMIVVPQLAKCRLLRPSKYSFNSKSLLGLAMTFSSSNLTFAAIYEVSQRNRKAEDICPAPLTGRAGIISHPDAGKRNINKGESIRHLFHYRKRIPAKYHSPTFHLSRNWRIG